MINIVELKPDQSHTVLNEGLDILTVLEDRDIYYHFRDNIFFKQLDHYISEKNKKSADKIRNQGELNPAEKVKVLHENNLIRSKFIKGFEKIRQQFFIYNDNIYSYTINNMENPTNIITVHHWENAEIAEKLESLARLSNSGIFNLFFGRKV